MAKKLLCLNYPGSVNDVDNMLNTVGGIEGLTKTFNEDGARLELRFRPDDIYSHSCFGDRIAASGLLVKCIKRKKMVEGKEECTYETKTVGVIDTFYRFQCMADFQYLPVAKVEDDGDQGKPKYKSILAEILPTDPFSDIKKTFNAEAPLFVLPTIFSRFDCPTDYCYKDDPQKREGRERRTLLEPSEMNFIGRTRKSRSVTVCMINWFDPTPKEPSESILNYAKEQKVNNKLLLEAKEAFIRRPIWSRNALVYSLGCARQDVKYILPCVAYYFYNGPFRRTWIRYGYDPRLDRNSKVYQSLDFRVKQSYYNISNTESLPDPKRSIYRYQLPLKKNDSEKYRNRYRASIIEQDAFLPSTSQSQKDTDRSKKLYAAFTFEPGLIPPYRQLCYQFCDIKVDKVQEIIHANDGSEPESCDEKDGWCAPGATEQIRGVLLAMVEDMLSTQVGSSTSSTYDAMEDMELSEDDYTEDSS